MYPTTMEAPASPYFHPSFRRSWSCDVWRICRRRSWMTLLTCERARRRCATRTSPPTRAFFISPSFPWSACWASPALKFFIWKSTSSPRNSSNDAGLKGGINKIYNIDWLVARDFVSCRVKRLYIADFFKQKCLRIRSNKCLVSYVIVNTPLLQFAKIVAHFVYFLFSSLSEWIGVHTVFLFISRGEDGEFVS